MRRRAAAVLALLIPGIAGVATAIVLSRTSPDGHVPTGIEAELGVQFQSPPPSGMDPRRRSGVADDPSSSTGAPAGSDARRPRPRARAAPVVATPPDADTTRPSRDDRLWTPPETPTREVRGVAKTAGGAPVCGVRVEVRDLRGNVFGSTVTGDDGSFRVEGVPAVKLRVVVAAQVHDGRATLGASVSPAPGAEPTEVVVSEGCVASGRVVGPDGVGVPDADVRWYRKSHRETLREPVLATTDPFGCFEVPVQRDAQTGLLADPTTRGESGLRWYYGYVAAPAGGGSGIEIRCDAGFRVEGRVTDAAGSPVGSVRLRFTAPSAGFTTIATSRGDGAISCGGLPAGGLPIGVQVDPADSARAGLVLSPSAVTPRQSGPVSFVLFEPVTLRARIVDATNAPVANWTIWIGSPSIGSERTIRTDADGRFSMPGLAPGRYRVRVTWIPNNERPRTHIVGEIEAGQPEVLLTYPEVMAR